MPCYLLSEHAYRSWNADRPQGYVKKRKGIQQPSKPLATAYDRAATQRPVIYETEHPRVLLWAVYDICSRRDWRLHCIATDPTHLHILLSWQDESVKWQDVAHRLKNLSSLLLGRKMQHPGRRWFVRRGSRKRVRDRAHFDYLINEYLPSHRGLCWREGDPAPAEPLVAPTKA